MKIYTKTGDKGETGLLGGHRVEKNHIVIQACGDLDEANCALGLARSQQLEPDIDALLAVAQAKLFEIGAKVASSLDNSPRSIELEHDDIERLENAIDRWDATLPKLSSFILPGGGRRGASLHFARAVCRRAERKLVAMVRDLNAESRFQQELVYLNRLGDLLFVLARLTNDRDGHAETAWPSN